MRVDGTIIVLHSGNYEFVCLRHRKTRTLYVSDLVEPPKCKDPGYGKLHVGIYIAAIQDAMDREKQRLRTNDDGKPSDRDDDHSSGSDKDKDDRDRDRTSRGDPKGNRGSRGGSRGGGRGGGGGGGSGNGKQRKVDSRGGRGTRDRSKHGAGRKVSNVCEKMTSIEACLPELCNPLDKSDHNC